MKKLFLILFCLFSSLIYGQNKTRYYYSEGQIIGDKMGSRRGVEKPTNVTYDMTRKLIQVEEVSRSKNRIDFTCMVTCVDSERTAIGRSYSYTLADCSEYNYLTILTLYKPLQDGNRKVSRFITFRDSTTDECLILHCNVANAPKDLPPLPKLSNATLSEFAEGAYYYARYGNGSLVYMLSSSARLQPVDVLLHLESFMTNKRSQIIILEALKSTYGREDDRYNNINFLSLGISAKSAVELSEFVKGLRTY